MSEQNVFVLLPRTSGRRSLPAEVVEPYRSLYEEAAKVIGNSPRASGVLSRRCVQKVLRDVVGALRGTFVTI